MRRDKGLTLIELIIAAAVFAVAALLVAPAIAHWSRHRIADDMVAALRALTTQQEIFRGEALVDQDGDGQGEYGLLGDLTGTAVLRGGTQPVGIGLLDSTFAPNRAGLATRKGYHIVVYLARGGSGAALSDAGRGAAATGQTIDLQELTWCAYAWPIRQGEPCYAYFINEEGVLYGTHGEVTQYHGTEVVPVANAAYEGEAFLSNIADGGADAANDGNVWVAGL